MSDNNYSKSIAVGVSPNAIQNALTKDMSNWWSEDFRLDGDVFTIGFGETKKTFETLEQSLAQNGFELVWLCTAASLLHPDVTNPEEWVGTRIVWNVQPEGNNTRITMTHEGLNTTLQCHDICVQGWDFFFLQSLKDYLETGIGKPFSKTETG